MEKALTYREIRPDLEAYMKEAQQNRHPIALLLDRVHNKRNLAAIFRLADAARIAEVILYRCDLDAASDNKIKKVARSAQDYVPRRSLSELSQVEALKAQYQLTALEITNRSVPYFAYQGGTPIALVIGNEQKGVSQELLDLCEASVHVPMMGRNSSMNVAMATGIATYGLLQNLGWLK